MLALVCVSRLTACIDLGKLVIHHEDQVEQECL